MEDKKTEGNVDSGNLIYEGSEGNQDFLEKQRPLRL